MSPEYQKINCKNCEFVYKLSADIWFRFLGCKHEPYHGKWVAEIKECPILSNYYPNQVARKDGDEA